MFFIGNGEVDIFLTIYSKKKLDENSMRQGPEKKKVKGKKKYVLFEGGHNEEEHHNFQVAIEPEFYKYTEYISRLHEGAYFGEISLISYFNPATTEKTVDYATIAYMKRENFEEIRNEFP